MNFKTLIYVIELKDIFGKGFYEVRLKKDHIFIMSLKGPPIITNRYIFISYKNRTIKCRKEFSNQILYIHLNSVFYIDDS